MRAGRGKKGAVARHLAFDLGAESSRAIVGTFTGEGLELEQLHRFPTRNVTVRGRRFWDVLYLFGEFQEALRQYALKYGPKLAGIGVDTWGVDFGLLGANGQLLANPVHYRDHRTDGVLEEAFEVMPREALYARTGIQFMPLNTLFQLWAMHKTAPQVLEEARTLLMMPDLLNYFLTGVAKAEYTIASTSQMLDVRRRTWSRAVFQAFGIPIGIMPEIVEPGTVLGPLDPVIAGEVGLDATPVIEPCAHDTGSAIAAVPAEGDDWVYLSCGTWSLLGAELPEPVTSEKALRYNFTNEGGICGTIRFLKNIMGLWVLQQCRAAWAKRGRAYEYQELTEMAQETPAFETVLDADDPVFLNPDDMLGAVATHCRVTGQKVPRSVGATVRATLEGLAARYAVVADELEDAIGRPIKRIHMVGGGVQNEMLCQFASDATGRPVIAGPVEATALGNLVAQAMATGRIKDLKAGRHLVARAASLKMYEPQNAKAWRKVVARFRKRA